jgi:hypothetical protein
VMNERSVWSNSVVSLIIRRSELKLAFPSIFQCPRGFAKAQLQRVAMAARPHQGCPGIVSRRGEKTRIGKRKQSLAEIQYYLKLLTTREASYNHVSGPPSVFYGASIRLRLPSSIHEDDTTPFLVTTLAFRKAARNTDEGSRSTRSGSWHMRYFPLTDWPLPNWLVSPAGLRAWDTIITEEVPLGAARYAMPSIISSRRAAHPRGVLNEPSRSIHPSTVVGYLEIGVIRR